MSLHDNSRNLPPIGQPKKTPLNARLEDLERKISRNFFEAAEALREIRDDKLYLVYAETFKEYCEKRLHRSISAVYEQLKMLEISKEIQEAKSPLGGQTPFVGEALTPKTVSSRQENISLPALRKMAKTPAKKSAQKKEVKMPKEDPRAKRWSEAMAKIKGAKDEEGFLEAVEKMLEDWGL